MEGSATPDFHCAVTTARDEQGHRVLIVMVVIDQGKVEDGVGMGHNLTVSCRLLSDQVGLH